MNHDSNSIEEEKILSDVRAAIRQRKKNRTPIVAVIIEPVQSEGGDRWATDDFYRNLRKLCLEEEVLFVFGKTSLFNFNTDGFFNGGRNIASNSFETIPDSDPNSFGRHG